VDTTHFQFFVDYRHIIITHLTGATGVEHKPGLLADVLIQLAIAVHSSAWNSLIHHVITKCRSGKDLSGQSYGLA
jgi:hypothetical protein